MLILAQSCIITHHLRFVTFHCKYWTIKFLSEFYCSLLTMFDLNVHVNFFMFFTTNISTLTWVFWTSDLMQINDECKIVIFSSFIHDSCSITISVLFFANFMHACIIYVDLTQLCCRIWIFNMFAKLSSFALFCDISNAILIRLNDLFVS